jgi:hypothetical protein
VSHPFDATVKNILGPEATDLIPVLHLPANLPARTLNVDLSTVSAATDVAFGFGDPLQQIADINFQSGPDPHVPARMLLYSAAYYVHYHVPVQSILILLRPAADHPRLTGQLIFQAGATRVEFQYEVMRLWQQPVDVFLTGGLTLLPLAPLCQLPADVSVEQALRDVVHRIDERLVAEVPYDRAVKLMTAAFVLAGLRVNRESLDDMFRGVRVMHESTAFDYYFENGLQKGRVQERQGILLELGWERFGPADAETEAAIRAIDNLDRLKRLTGAVLSANSWHELLATS